MEAVELRPLGLGELLDRTFSLYRRHFWIFVGIMALPSVFLVPYNVTTLSMRGAATPGRAPLSPTVLLASLLPGMAFLLLFSVVYAFAIGAATFAVSDTYLGEQPTVRGSYKKVGRKIWRILGLISNVVLRLIGVGMVGGIVAAILAVAPLLALRGGAVAGAVGAIAAVFIYLGLGAFMAAWSMRYAVSISALLLENIGVLAAIRRSIELTSGRKRQIFVAVLLNMLIGYAGAIIFQGPFLMLIFLSSQGKPLPAWLILASSLSGMIGSSISMPLLMIVLVLCYYDTRIRKEAFDVQYMLTALDGPVSSPPTAAPLA